MSVSLFHDIVFRTRRGKPEVEITRQSEAPESQRDLLQCHKKNNSLNPLLTKRVCCKTPMGLMYPPLPEQWFTLTIAGDFNDSTEVKTHIT